MKMKKQIIVIIVLLILLVRTLGYIGIVKYSDYKQQKDLGVFQQGAQYGYEQAVIQVIQTAVTCEQIPLRIENQTINMIAVDCLQQSGGN